VFAQRLYAVTFGGVVAAGEVVDAQLARFVVGALGDFAGDVGFAPRSAASWM